MEQSTSEGKRQAKLRRKKWYQNNFIRNEQLKYRAQQQAYQARKKAIQQVLGMPCPQCDKKELLTPGRSCSCGYRDSRPRDPALWALAIEQY